MSLRYNITFTQYPPLIKIFFIIFTRILCSLPYLMLAKTLLKPGEKPLVLYYDMHVIIINNLKLKF